MSVVENETMERLEVSDDDPSEAAQREESHSEVMRFLDRLPPNQKEVIRLKFQGEMSYKEISEVTDLSVLSGLLGSVQSRCDKGSLLKFVKTVSLRALTLRSSPQGLTVLLDSHKID